MADQFQQEVAKSLGNYPFVYYGSYQIDFQDISYFSLFYLGSMPCFKMSFYDTLNLMSDKAMPLDDSKIKVFLNPRSDQLKEILIQFKITNFSVSQRVFHIEGILDVNLLHVIQYKSYPNLTSHKALQQIAKECGVGFNTNIEDTDDAMTWVNTGSIVSDFMEEIVETSYKSDNSFMVSFVDFYYNFNFIDLAKELDRNIDLDLSITDKTLLDVVNSAKETVTSLVITNDESFRETNLFFEKFKIINNSTDVSLRSGYQNTVNYYDTFNKELLVFNIDSITSKGNKTIILKGSPQDEEFFNLNRNVHYVGTLDTDNSHKNYNFSFIQNEKNIFDLEKMGLEITMRTPNYSIYKYQKIKVFISNQTNTPAASLKNSRLSGDWLIIDIKYIYSNNEFNQVIRLVKRELELSDEELSNENPIPPKSETTAPSSNNDVTNNQNTVLAPSGSTSSVPNTQDPGDVSDILTKDIWRRIYTGKVNPKVIEVMYEPVVSALVKYGMNTKPRIAAFLAQINTESSFLKFVTELSSGAQYDNRVDLGNGPTDGPTYKGRSFIQLTGKANYKKAGDFLNKDFVNNPDTVAADNATHIKASDTTDQLANSVLVSIRYWLKGSSWGNLNNYADDMDTSKAIDFGSATSVPNTQTDATNSGFKTKAKNNFATQANSSNDNLLNFTLICFGINGGYNGYNDRINNWNSIRKYFV